MSPADAAKLLELSGNASPEQLEARFQELRQKLEDRIAKAPTPGLKAKYRESLNEITTAFETLTLAADSSALPVTRKQEAGSKEQGGASPSPAGSPLATALPTRPAQAPTLHSKRKSGGKEFAIVTLIAVLILAGGGWWIMKTRAENEEKARIAAEAKLKAEELAAAQKAEGERQAQVAKEQAERDRLAKDAAATAEKERQEKLYTALRSRVAELNVAYDALMRAESTAERELSELKSQERELVRDLKGGATPESRRLAARMRAQEAYIAWLRETLPVHPAKVAKARLDEMLAVRALDEASQAVEAYIAALDQLKADLAAAKAGIAVTGRVNLDSNVPGAVWRLTDGFGAVHQGTTPGQVATAGAGLIVVEFSYKTFPLQRSEATLAAREERKFSADFKESIVRIRTTPSQATVTPKGETIDGWQVYRLGPGEQLFRIEAPGHAAVSKLIKVGSNERQDIEVSLDNRPLALLMAEATELLPQATAAQAAFNRFGNTRDVRLRWLAAAAWVAGPDGFKTVIESALDQYAGHTWLPRKLDFNSSQVAPTRWMDYGVGGILISPAPEWADRILTETRQLNVTASPALVATPPVEKTPVDEAVDLIIQGKDPVGSGLRRQDLTAQTKLIVGRLMAKNRAELAYSWMLQASPEAEHLPARLRTRGWMNQLIAAGRVDEAIELFQADNARWSAADPTMTYFVSSSPSTGAMTEMMRIARHRADRAGMEKLAALVRSLMAVPTAPAGVLLSGESWRYAWLEPLQMAGLAANEAKLVEQVVAIASSTRSSEPGKPKSPRIPGDALPAAVNVARIFTDQYGQGLDPKGKMFSLLRAKQLVAQGQAEAAYREIQPVKVSREDMMKALAFSHASLGSWNAAVDAMERSDRAPFNEFAEKADAATQQAMATNRRLYRMSLASTFGLGAADRLDERQAFAALRGVSDPLERVLAVSSYILRRREMDAMTPEQREFLRTLPSL